MPSTNTVLQCCAQDQENFLRPSESEAGDQDLLTCGNTFIDKRDQPAFLCLAVGMEPVAVSRLYDRDVRSELRDPDPLDGTLGKG